MIIALLSVGISVLAQAPEMVLVEGGTFSMGCSDEQSDCSVAEYPLHEVTLSSFYIGKYEVTQAEYEAVMGSNPSSFNSCSDCPVEGVSWDDVQEFLRRLNDKMGEKYRLPTEAEWEYAARGGNKSKGYQYSGSNSISSVGWYEDNSVNKIHPVGQKEPNELGLYDLSGNIVEWCQDRYDKKYYATSPASNPKGPERGRYRISRGGSWISPGGYCRVAIRSYSRPGSRIVNLGFRVARSSQ